MTVLDAAFIRPPRLRFDPAMPSRSDEHPYRGLRRNGPYDSTRVNIFDRSILIVFPSTLKPLASKLVRTFQEGQGGFPGFGQMFRVSFTPDQVTPLVIDGDFTTLTSAARTYRDAIADWSRKTQGTYPEFALVLVPHSERWETERPYYEAKASFARLGIPTQMVTAELLQNEREFGWSVANIALAMFAKLGGIPWVVESPSSDQDLVLGVGRADIRDQSNRKRIFGYALSFTSNGLYRQTWSFTPASDEQTYLERLEDSIRSALSATSESDEPFARLVIHLGKKTGWKEALAAQRALASVNVAMPVALLRLDETSLYDIANGQGDTLAPRKGLVVRLGERQSLLQTEGLTPIGVPNGPLLVELDERSGLGPEALDGLVAQVFRLAHANWRGFNAKSQSVTLVYGELLAQLVGYLEEVETWDPTLLRKELLDKPWFL